MNPIVDVHAHYLPDRLADEFERLGGRPIRMRHSEDQGERIAALDAAGVDEQVIGLGALQPYWADPAAAVQGARIANDLYAETCARQPRLRAFGAVPLPHGDAAAVEAARCLDELGFAGIGIGCSAQGMVLDDPALDPLWAAVDERGAAVHIHPGVRNDVALGIGEFPMLLGPVYGSPAEEAVALARLAIRGVIARFPRIEWIASTMGGALLGHLGKLGENLRVFERIAPAVDAAAVEAQLRSLWLDTSGLDAVSAEAARVHGFAERLVLGSDAPWGSAVEARGAVEGHFPEAAEAILHRGATVVRSARVRHQPRR